MQKGLYTTLNVSGGHPNKVKRGNFLHRVILTLVLKYKNTLSFCNQSEYIV